MTFPLLDDSCHCVAMTGSKTNTRHSWDIVQLTPRNTSSSSAPLAPLSRCSNFPLSVIMRTLVYIATDGDSPALLLTLTHFLPTLTGQCQDKIFQTAIKYFGTEAEKLFWARDQWTLNGYRQEVGVVTTWPALVLSFTDQPTTPCRLSRQYGEGEFSLAQFSSNSSLVNNQRHSRDFVGLTWFLCIKSTKYFRFTWMKSHPVRL